MFKCLQGFFDSSKIITTSLICKKNNPITTFIWKITRFVLSKFKLNYKCEFETLEDY